MQGSVYHLALTDKDQGLPHPHVVVLTFSGNRDCLVVPAYSADGFMINEYIDAQRARGREESHLYVKLDNAEEIDFVQPFPAKEAIWCVARMRRVSQTVVSKSTRIGQMKAPGLLKIASSLLAFSEIDPRDFSKSSTKALRNLVQILTDMTKT